MIDFLEELIQIEAEEIAPERFGVEFCELSGEERYLARLAAIRSLRTNTTDTDEVSWARRLS